MKKTLSRKQQFNADPGTPEKAWGKRMVDATRPAPMTMKEQIQKYVKIAVSSQAVEEGFESFEEADDFEDEETEPPWVSEYEIPDTKEEDNINLEGDNAILEQALKPEDPPEPEVEPPEAD